MPIEKDNLILWTAEELAPIVAGDGIIDATPGGLVLGNSHCEGGIKVMCQYQDEPLYQIIAEVEGWEYIMNPWATSKHLQRLEQLNNQFDGTAFDFEEYPVPENISVLDTTRVFQNMPDSNKILLVSGYGQFIINRHSTKEYLTELNEKNSRTSANNT